MISPGARWSLPRGNTLVPSRWQATSRDPMQHESLPRPVTTAPAAIKPVYRRGRHGTANLAWSQFWSHSPPSATVHWRPRAARPRWSGR